MSDLANQKTIKTQWISAISYMLVLLMVICGYFLENYDLNIFGVRLHLIILIPYLIYYFVNRSHKVEFIALHTRKAMRIFLGYFGSMILINFVMSFMGLASVFVSPRFLFGFNVLVLISMIPLFIVVFPTIITTALGIVRSFKFILPYKSIEKFVAAK